MEYINNFLNFSSTTLHIKGNLNLKENPSKDAGTVSRNNRKKSPREDRIARGREGEKLAERKQLSRYSSLLSPLAFILMILRCWL